MYFANRFGILLLLSILRTVVYSIRNLFWCMSPENPVLLIYIYIYINKDYYSQVTLSKKYYFWVTLPSIVEKFPIVRIFIPFFLPLFLFRIYRTTYVICCFFYPLICMNFINHQKLIKWFEIRHLLIKITPFKL